MTAVWMGSQTLRQTHTVIVAPHADDELLGCGGWLIRASRSGGRVSVVFTMRRERERQMSTRRALAGIEAQILDIGIPEDASDPNDRLTEALATFVGDEPATVLIPARQDPHPHHQAAHRAGRALIGGARVVLEYEGLCPHPNPTHWLDTSEVVDEVAQRIALYEAENRRMRLVECIRSLSSFRACVSLRRAVTAAEAYRCACTETP